MLIGNRSVTICSDQVLDLTAENDKLNARIAELELEVKARDRVLHNLHTNRCSICIEHGTDCSDLCADGMIAFAKRELKEKKDAV